MSYKYSVGQPFVYPRNDLSYTANFMRMMFGVPAEEYKVNDVLCARWTASSCCMRITSRTPRPRRCAFAGPRCQPVRLHRSRHRLALGPAHGGANEASLQMLEEIGNVSKVPEFIRKVKDKNSGVRLMGFGHRVYRTTTRAPS